MRLGMDEGVSMNDGQTHDKVATETPDLLAERIERLRELFPEAFAEGKVDFSKLRAALGDTVDERPERYLFTWAGKRDAIRILQTPSRATLVPCPEESVNFDTTQNLFIEGDNLEVLKLLYKPYFGRVKMIYIDPPYNTGNDFVYPDDYKDPLDTYLKLTGQKDAEGNVLTSNPETSGRYHSAWLSMMYPRLFLARQLLQDDGFIVVSIADHEAGNLRALLNEVFGEENFVGQLVWKSRQFPDERAVTNLSTDHEYLLVYSRRSDSTFRGVSRDESKFSNPDEDPRGPWMSRSLLGLATVEMRPNLHYPITDPETGAEYLPPANAGWRYSRERMTRLIETGCILFPSNPTGRPREKKFRADLEKEFTSFRSVIDDIFTAHGTVEIRNIFGFDAFDFPKPTSLIARLVEQITNSDDIVVDFFAGSCTTANAVLEVNRRDGGTRRFVVVQLPEPISGGAEAFKSGYKTIADLGKERIRRVIKKMKEEAAGNPALPTRATPEDLGFKVFKLAESNWRRWRGVQDATPDALADQMEMFVDPLVEGWSATNVLYEIALKEGFGLNCKIESRTVAGATVYQVTDPDSQQSFLACLDDAVPEAVWKSLGLTTDTLFVCRDRALDDTAAANLALQCRLKTI